jgi:hypothetical protein
MTTAEIKELLAEMPEWLAAERACVDYRVGGRDADILHYSSGCGARGELPGEMPGDGEVVRRDPDAFHDRGPEDQHPVGRRSGAVRDRRPERGRELTVTADDPARESMRDRPREGVYNVLPHR